MSQEACNRFGVDVAKLQGCDPSAPPGGNELEQQSQRITVGADGVGAGAPLLGQVVCEERLHMAEQTDIGTVHAMRRR
jgi:hypothetical protein